MDKALSGLLFFLILLNVCLETAAADEGDDYIDSEFDEDLEGRELILNPKRRRERRRKHRGKTQICRDKLPKTNNKTNFL